MNYCKKCGHEDHKQECTHVSKWWAIAIGVVAIAIAATIAIAAVVAATIAIVAVVALAVISFALSAGGDDWIKKNKSCKCGHKCKVKCSLGHYHEVKEKIA